MPWEAHERGIQEPEGGRKLSRLAGRALLRPREPCPEPGLTPALWVEVPGQPAKGWT